MKRSPACLLLGLAVCLIAAPFRLQAEDELITNPSFDNSLEAWTPMNIQGAAGTFEVKEIEGGKHAVCITVPAAAEKRYFIQLDQTLSAPLSTGKTYVLSFRAKSKPALPIVITIGSKDQGEIWRQDQIALTEEWANYSYPVTCSQDVASAYLNISGLAAAAGEYWFTNVSLKATPKAAATP